MPSTEDAIKEAMAGIWISKAILEDYCEVVSKIENTSPDIIKTRIVERVKNIHGEWKKKHDTPES